MNSDTKKPKFPAYNFRRVKLSSSIRDKIKDTLVRKLISPQEVELRNAKTALALRCYNAFYPEDQRQLMTTIPQSWLSYDHRIRVEFQTDNSTCGYDLPMEHSMPFACCDFSRRLPIPDNDGELHLELGRIKQTEKNIKAYRAQLEQDLASIWPIAQTTYKLADALPAAVPILEMMFPLNPDGFVSTVGALVPIGVLERLSNALKSATKP